MYGRAANLFKMAKKWKEAGNTFTKIAGIHDMVGFMGVSLMAYRGGYFWCMFKNILCRRLFLTAYCTGVSFTKQGIKAKDRYLTCEKAESFCKSANKK